MAASTPAIAINVEHATPREIEDTTQKALARDYATAWQTMTEALDQNRADLLSANFLGTADDKLTATIQQQTKAGLHQHITDQGHTVDAVFYSPEGSAIELHDTAHLQIDVMDGSKVVHTENATVHYVALADGGGKLLEGAGSGGGSRFLISLTFPPLPRPIYLDNCRNSYWKTCKFVFPQLGNNG